VQEYLSLYSSKEIKERRRRKRKKSNRDMWRR
jgi:hypothetical protein